MAAKGVDLRPSGKFCARFVHRGRNFVREWDTEAQAVAWICTSRELSAGTYVDQELTDPATGSPLPPSFGEYAQVLERRIRVVELTKSGLTDDEIAAELGMRIAPVCGRPDKVRWTCSWPSLWPSTEAGRALGFWVRRVRSGGNQGR